MDKRILIIVPAYNEEKNIPLVVNEVNKSLPNSDILIINDSSLDRTSSTARAAGVRVVDLPCNLGIGGAVQTGFKYAARHDYDYAVQLDGDGQHIASEVAKLIQIMESKECDMVIGSRFLGTQSFRTTATRRAGIKVFYYIYRMLIDTRITDSTSGFRAYNKRAIEFLSRQYPDDYPEPESIVMLKRKGFTVLETGVAMRERLHGTSSITPLKGMYYMAKVILSIFFSYLRAEK